MKLVDLDRLKWPNIAIFDMNLHGECMRMVRLSDLQALAPLEDVALVEHGRWVRQNGSACVFKCSACGFKFAGAEIANYCPNCGTKMDRSAKK